VSSINTYTVTQVNKYIKKILDNDFILSNIMIKGEISNFKNHSSGHLYFSLKDESSNIKCVMFKGQTLSLKFKPEDGMKVIISGYISAYERDGQYQLYCDFMELDGVGDLYAKYEKLKEKLSSEGLFDEARKKKLPMLPKSVGVITSATGAVIRDILNVSLRRFPKANIKLFPSSVQGENAYLEIIHQLELINEKNLADVIIIARGGGSIEDLWNFNSEELAYAISKSKIPVVSAVGHETDFTICDFVADLRAPTPSAAAELCTPDFADIYAFLEKSDRAMSASLTKKISYNRSLYERLSKSGVLANPQRMLSEKIMTVEHLDMKMSSALSLALTRKKHEYDANLNKLHALSPLNVLSRGYSVAMSEDGRVIRSESDISCGDEIKIYSHSVTMGAKVTEIIPASDTEDNKNG